MIENVGITATQEGATPKQLYMFRRLIQQCKVYHGGVCIGGDEQTAIIAKREFGMRCIGHPPIKKIKMSRILDVYDQMMEPKDYMVRNEVIATISNVGIALPKGMHEELRSGTWATVRRFRSYGKSLAIIWPIGTVTYERDAEAKFWENLTKPN